MRACWSTAWPVLEVLSKVVGPARLVTNNDFRIEYHVMKRRTGEAVVRIGCSRRQGGVFAMFVEAY